MRGTVTFLADSFTTFTEPGVGRAAIELLEMAGWTVRLESGGCCGRASLSKGLVDDAKAKASRLAGLLTSGDAAGTPVVGCEPSCVWTLRDEHARAAARRPAGARRGRPGAAGGGAADRGGRRRRARAAVGLVARRAAGALPRALPPEGRGRDRGDGGDAVPDPRCRGGRAGRRVLRDGRVVRLRGRALRGVDGGGCGPALPRRARRAGRRPWSRRPGSRAGSRSRTARCAAPSTRSSCCAASSRAERRRARG